MKIRFCIVMLTIFFFRITQTKASNINEINVFAKRSPLFVLRETGTNYTLSTHNISSLRGGNRSRFIQMRGVGERSDYTPLVRRSVALFLDGIDYSHFPQAVSGEIESLERFEYGPSHLDRIGGALYYSGGKTEKVSIEVSDEKSLTMGLIGEQLLGNSIFNYRVEKNTAEGFYDNAYTGKGENNRDETRLRLNWNNKFFKQVLHYTKLNNGYDAFSLDNSFKTLSNRPGRDELELMTLRSQIQSENKRWTLWGEFLRANSNYSYDEDWGNESFYDYDISFIKKRKRFELGAVYNGPKIMNKFRLNHIREKQMETGFNSSVVRKHVVGEVERKMIEWQTTYEYKELLFNIGAGQVRQRYHNDQMFNAKKDDFLSLARLEYRILSNVLAIAYGSKSGGFSTADNIPESRKTYGKEHLFLVENTLTHHFSRSSFIRLSPFFMWRRNAQVSTSYQDNPSDPSSFTFYIDNVAHSRAFGLESYGKWQPTMNLQVAGSLSFIESSYESYENPARSLMERELPYTPEYQGVIEIKYFFNNDIFMTTKYHQFDNYYFSNSHDQKSKVTKTFDLDLNYKKDNILYSIYVRNLLNDDYETRGFFFGNRPPHYESELFTQRGEPRVIGAKIDYTF